MVLMTIRPAKQDDLTVIEGLATNFECVQWGGLPHLDSQLLAEQWRRPELTPSFVQVAETASGLRGYSDVYQISPNLARFRGIATNLDVAASLIDTTDNKAVGQGIPLQTSLSSKEEGRTLFPRFIDHPLYSLLSRRGYGRISITRVMRLLRYSGTRQLIIPSSYQVVDFNESLLPSLMAMYYAAWPTDYYHGEDRSEIAAIFRQSHVDDLRLAISDVGDVVGYVLTSRTTKLGAIDEVAVHPTERRKGLGRVLTDLAIQSLGDRIISLVVMDENPARYLYEDLGFVVWEERLDLRFTGG